MTNLGQLSDGGIQRDSAAAFRSFSEHEGARLKRALCAHFGMDVGAEVHADAMAWAWEHWDHVSEMANPTGYLYRVAQSSARRHRRLRRPVGLPTEPRDELDGIEPGLEVALGRLPHAQRVAVLLVHGLGWSYQEAADALDVSHASVRNHVHRGLKRLRSELGDDT